MTEELNRGGGGGNSGTGGGGEDPNTPTNGIYMWREWVETELKKIYIGKPTTSSTQWPCDSGYHVPTKDERVALVAAMTALWIDTSNWNCMKTYLKIPFAGRCYFSNSPSNKGTLGDYWASNAATGFFSYGWAYTLKFASSYLDVYETNRSTGCSVRPFKNTPVALSIEDIDYFDPYTQLPVIPWYETLYWSNNWIAWIYRDDTNWIITLSSDGETWITIADKNLWATTVYNDWDTLSQANCWNYFQRWNNYWFPRTWGATTSSTQVDASGYWPWNYYSSSTLIIVTDSPYDWSSVKNNNLRWWVYTPINRVTIRPNGTEKQIRPAWWQPGANTLCYYPLNWDLNDYSGNNRNLTWSWVTYTSWGPWQVGVFENWWYAYYTNQSLFNISYPFTYSFYVQADSIPTKNTMAITICNANNIASYDKSAGFALDSCTWYNYYNNWYYYVRWWTPIANTWYHVVYTFDGSKQKLYLNWTLVWENNCSWSYTGFSNASIMLAHQHSSGGDLPFNGKLSNVIIEDRARTAQEVLDYYNQTKSLYGIS